MNLRFIKKYSLNLTIKEFENRGEKAIKENKPNLFEYFDKFENIIKSRNNLDSFSNINFSNNLLKSCSPSKLLNSYENYFFEAISFIEQLLEDLKKNISLLPISIKYICKIISILIRNKFKNIKKIEENAFISKFLINKLLLPIISLPNYNTLIDDFYISGNTIKNIKKINNILSKLFSGNLFQNNSKEGDYTPFNWFFLDKIENIFFILEKSTNVILPNFIEKYVNNELSKDFSYEYFEENEEQIFTNISICFSFNNLYYLLKGIEKSSNLFQINNPNINKINKIFQRLIEKDNIKEIKDINEKISNNLKKNIKIIKSKNKLK